MAASLGSFEQVVLLSVLSLGDDAYGRAIFRDVQTRLQRDIATGAVYATLDRLEEKSLISSKLGPGLPERGGRPRRYYSIEKAGLRALNASKEAADKMWFGFNWPLPVKAS
jgi:PadR family transcriptional regulator PadR